LKRSSAAAIAGIAVRVVAHRERAVGLLERVRIDIARDAEDLVVVALRQLGSLPAQPAEVRRTLGRTGGSST
jgi:hypothetical protein